MKDNNKPAIHRDLRLCGSLLRLFPGFNAGGFRIANSVTRRIYSTNIRARRLGAHSQNIETAGGRLRLLVCSPAEIRRRAPLMLWFHGGGLAMGAPEQDSIYIKLFTRLGMTVVCPDYRLSIQSPYPAAIGDCYAALQWVYDNRQLLNCDGRIFVGGSSAGGGLAAALCILSREKSGPKIDLQVLIYPMLDDRTGSENTNHSAPCWNAKSNIAAWRLYLGNLFGSPLVPCSAAPARCADLSSLPAAVGYIGTVDLFYGEASEYFARLAQSGVNSDLLKLDGCFHAFDIIRPHSGISQRAMSFLTNSLKQHITQP